MSLFRDISHIKTIASLCDSKDISEDACRMILADMELKLRLVIKEAFKFTRVFSKDTLSDTEVNCALENLRLSSKLLGMRIPYTNSYTYSEDTKWNLANPILTISKQLELVEHEHFQNKYPIELSIDWLTVHGTLLSTPQNRGTCSHLDLLKKPAKPDFFELKPKFETTAPTQIFKEIQPNILSKEADKFLNSFFRILKENLEGFSKTVSQAKINFRRFIEGNCLS